MENRQVIITCSVISVSTLALLWWWRRNKQRIPTEWKAVGKVSELHLYPLKSGRRVEVSEANCTQFGLEQITDKAVYKLQDRFLIVYHGTHLEHRTARTHPKMVLIEVSNHDGDHVALDAPNMRTLYVKIPKTTEGNIFTITMHGNEPVDLVDCGEEAAAWISRYVLDSDTGLRLGFKDANVKIRSVQKPFKKFYPIMGNEDLGMFSDLTSYMLMNKASVNDMNTRLQNKVPFYQFRPTIYVDVENQPYVEESWNYIKIGDEVVFQNVKPCTRCVFTTIDMETGTFNHEREPLKTLKTYKLLKNEEQSKMENHSPVLGIHLGLRKSGIIRVNDTIYIG